MSSRENQVAQLMPHPHFLWRFSHFHSHAVSAASALRKLSRFSLSVTSVSIPCGRLQCVVSVYNPFGAVTCGRNLGLRVRCGLVEVDADRQAKADASLVLSMPVGSQGSGALAVACVVAGPSSSCDEGLDPV